MNKKWLWKRIYDVLAFILFNCICTPTHTSFIKVLHHIFIISSFRFISLEIRLIIAIDGFSSFFVVVVVSSHYLLLLFTFHWILTLNIKLESIMHAFDFICFLFPFIFLLISIATYRQTMNKTKPKINCI